MSSNGRPRNVDYPRITFRAPGRTFDRLLKECSLSHLKETVGRKLGLEADSVVQLAQLRDGEFVELEDEDDFDAFYALANSQRLASVQVTITANVVATAAKVSSPVDDDRPRKKHKRKREATEGAPEREAEPHVEVQTSQPKRRKVAFAETTANEGDERTSVSDELQKHKKKDDSGIVTAVAVPERGSSHDSSETPKKKKEKLLSDDAEGPKRKKHKARRDAPDSQTTEGKDQGAGSKKQDTRTETGDNPPRTSPEISTLESEPLTETPAERSRPQQVVGNGPDLSSFAPDVSSSPKKMSKKQSPSKHRPDDASKEQSNSSQQVAGADAPKSKGTDEVQNDSGKVEKATTTQDKEKDVSGDSKGDPKKRRRSSTVIENGASDVEGADHETGDAETERSAPVPDTTNERIRRTSRKSAMESGKPSVAAKVPVDAPPKDGASDEAGSQAMTKDKVKPSEGKAKKEKEAKPSCIVCNKAPKHDLVDCPVVQEGPTSIQKRIKGLRVLKKLPEDEKLSLIAELQKIKAEQRELNSITSKQKTRETKNVNVPSRSRHALPHDERVKDLADDANDVAGVSKGSQPMNETPSSNRTSTSPSGSASSSDEEGPRVPHKKQAGGDSLLIVPGVDNLSGLADLDLDALVKGPESSLLSIRDLPSSDEENNDDDEKMSGEPEDETEEHSPVKSIRKSSSESHQSDSEDDKSDDSGGKSEADIMDDDAEEAAENTTTTDHPPSNADKSDSTELLDESHRNLAGQRKTAATAKTSKRGEGLSLTQVSAAIQNGAANTSKAAVNAPSEPPRRSRQSKGSNDNISSAKTNGTTKKKGGNEKTGKQPSPIGEWTSLKVSSQTDDDGGTLVDELVPSSPGVTRLAASKKSSKNGRKSGASTKEDPLFAPSSSQPPFPYSQAERGDEPSRATETDSERGTARRKSVTQARAPRSAFRRLSEMPSGPIFSATLRTREIAPTASRAKSADLYGRKGNDGDDDESESSSESDSEDEKALSSHIPRQRIAGKGL